jgi:hypothetical protein
MSFTDFNGANTSSNSANQIQSSLTTNFNVTPYYDYYKPESEYYRILFKPGYSVQGRELTQIQTMIQNQIKRFGTNIFKDGSIIIPGAFHIRSNYGDVAGNPIPYVKIQNLDASNNTVNVASFIGHAVKGASSNISAQVITVADTDGTTTNTKTLYVQYLSASSANAQVRVFAPGETLSIANTTITAKVLNNDPVANTGYGSWFEISEGVFFAKDHFIYFPTQSTILERYNPNPSSLVGFYVYEDIVTASADSSLLDPAQQSSNYGAPGADRLRLDPQLTVFPYGTTPPANFVTLLSISNGNIQILNSDTRFNSINDAMAQRMYDVDGDFVLRGLNVTLQEHENNGINNGRYTPAQGGNTDLLIASVSAGKAYVKGYTLTNPGKYDISISKPMDFQNVGVQLSSSAMGQYLNVNEFVGTWTADVSSRVYFYDTPNKRITNGGIPNGQKWSTGSESGNVIGSAIATSVQYVSGTKGYDAVYNLYLADITMLGSNNFANVASLYYTGGGVASGADVVGSTVGIANTVLQATYPQPLLYYVGSQSTKTVRDVNGNGSLTYNYNQTATSLYLSTQGNVSLTIAGSGTGTQELPYGTGYLSQTDMSQDITVTYQASINIGPLWGAATVSSMGGGNILYGVSTQFTKLNVGDKIELSGLSNTYYITAITSDTQITVSAPVPASVSTSQVFKAYKAGDIANLNGVGVRNGSQRSVYVSGSPRSVTLSISMQEGYSTTVPVTVTYKVATAGIQEVTKVLEPQRYVKINVATHPNGTTGPYPLGFSDVYAIRKIVRKSGSAPSSLTDGDDLTSYFSLDRGQNDIMYDTASIIPKGGFTPGASDYYLVYLDYFLPSFSGYSGYFSINSYNIDDITVPTPSNAIRTEQVPFYISSTSHNLYDLRNYLDFRPVKTNTATDATAIGSASVNPAKSTTFYYSGEMFFPVPSTEITYSYSYYLGRQDVLVGNKDGILSVMKGTASSSPVPPAALDTQMAIAIINLTPYPSLSPAYGNIIGRQDLACSIRPVSTQIYTMRDIGLLDSRIKNLEYYASLTLLESSALNMNIINGDGLNRFKNGIFIDTFKDSSLSALYTNPDMRISFDPIELCIKPLYSVKQIYYDYLGGGNSVMSNGMVTFAYTANTYFTQPWVTTYLNLERNAYYFVGRMTLSPSDDIWVDTHYAPDQYVNISSNGALINVSVGSGPNVPVTTAVQSTTWLGQTWGAWTQFITGYTVYNLGPTSGTYPTKTFSTYADAVSYEQNWTRTWAAGNALIVQTTENDRSGSNNFVTHQSGQSVGGYNVINTSAIPYIQPQDIIVNIKGLKPNSPMHVWFDSVNVDAYCTPLTEAQYNAIAPLNTYSANGVQNIAVSTLLHTAGYATMGTPLTVNPDGSLYYSFKILDSTQPANAGAPKFTVGQKLMLVQDNNVLAPGATTPALGVTTWASGYFFAQGTQQTLQETVYSTQSVAYSSTPLFQSYLSFANTTIVNTAPPPYSCFNPEAKVLMADKTWKPISSVNVGEKVIGANGDINTVMKSRTINVGDRKMVKFQEGFYATDDHIFLTDKGWKTWDPKSVIRKNGTNQHILEGENREEGIDPLDKLKIVDMESDDKVNFKFVDYHELGTEIVDFDPDYTVYDLTLSGDSTYIVEGYVVHNCCMAYNVMIKVPSDEEGVFCLGFDVFVHTKSTSRDMWFEVRTLDSSGAITSTQLPGSYVYIKNADIPVSPDGVTNPCQVRFDYPIFLSNNKDYAFTLHGTSGLGGITDPDTYLWCATLGQNDVNNKGQFNNRQNYGNFYFTNDNITWNVYTDTDLVIKVYTANFTTGTTTFNLGQQGIERWYLSNVSASFATLINDHFVTGDTLTLSGVNGTITVGDTLTGNVSGTNAAGKLISVSGGKYQTSNTRYQIGEKVTATSGGYGVVTQIANNSAVLTFYNDTYSNVYVEMRQSTGGFKVGDWIQDTRSGGYAFRAKITDILNYTYSGVHIKPDTLNFIKTGTQYSMDTYKVGALSDSGYVNVSESSDTFFQNEMQIYSKSLESSTLSGNRSNKLAVKFESNSIYTSPLLDLSSTYCVLIENLINNDYTGETNPSGGAALNKYISETITLAPGQDASDLNVYLANYRPPGTEVLVYCKLMNQYDPDNFNNKPWIQMPYQGNNGQRYSSASDTSNYIDYSYALPTTVMTGPNGEFQYTYNGTTYTNFQYYAIKILLLSGNAAVVPKASELRAIALQL